MPVVTQTSERQQVFSNYQVCIEPWQHIRNHDNTSWTMTTHHEPWRHITNHDDTSQTMMTHHEPWRHITNHDDTSRTITTHHEPWWHITNHDKTSQTTMKHHEPPWNHQKLPRITTNHYKSYCKVLNIIEVAVYVNCPRKYGTNFRNTRDPTRWFNHDDFQWTMTLNHNMTQKELCIKPYGFLVSFIKL